MYLARHRNAAPNTLDRLFDGLLTDWPFVAAKGSEPLPLLDVSETEAEFRVRVELPGVSPADVDVTLDDDVLTIRGEKKPLVTDEDETPRRLERRYGRFSRSVRLPTAVDAAGVSAASKDGVLTVLLPKRADARARTIEVKPAD